MKIVKLDIDENSILAGIDAVALVEEPAIEEDFMYFSKQDFAETYNDYPKSAVEAAKAGIERNKANGNKCATQVGKVRAQQLANREAVSLDTVRRMRSFLIRQRDNYDLAVKRKDYDACGWISYMLWGGPTALGWAEKILRQAGEEFADSLDDACWPGYEAIGTKMKDGREVPNCVPKDNFNEIIVEELIKTELAKENNLIDLLPESTQDAIIDALDDVGISEEELIGDGFIEIDKDAFISEAFAQITSNPNKPSIADFGNIAVRYKYTGPVDNRNRPFCARVMRLNKVYRKEDINQLSITGANEEFGTYDIFRYKGNYNCRHFWKEVFYKRENTITDDKRPLANSNRIFDGTTLNSKGINIPQSEVLVGQDFSSLDEEQIVLGPLMKANKLIPRIDENGEKYYVYFTPESIKRIAYKMMEDKLIDSVNIEHDDDDKVDDAFLIESWIVDDPAHDKATKYGFAPNVGDWYGAYKIKNNKVWEQYIKTGLVKGFSVQGFFEQHAEKMSANVCAITKGKPCMCGKSESGMCDGSHLK